MDNLSTALIFDDQTFEGLNLSQQAINGREFQSCVFKNCDLSGADLGKNKFIDCEFRQCNLASASLFGSIMNGVEFKDCKLLGILFSDCHDLLFNVGFSSCILDYSSFMGKKMVKTKFTDCSLKEVTFSQANLSEAKFDKCDMNGAVFSGTDLTQANLATAVNYTIDPEINTLKKASFSVHGLPGLLYQNQIKVVD